MMPLPFRVRHVDFPALTIRRLCGLCLLCVSLASAAEPASIPYTSEVLAEGLSHPWSLAFLPDGSMLITERPGTLRRIVNGQVSEPIQNVPPVYAESQGGLFDVVLHPDYADNGWLYLSLAHGDAEGNATRVVRARLQDEALIDVEPLFTAQPSKDTPVHYGGRLAFLPDNTFVLTVGDGFDYREYAQRLDNHLGKLVRLHDDGRVPDDNPFVDAPDALPEILSWGHRNPQAIVYDAARDLIWSHEHGPAGGDEVNLIRAGQNYGWPIATHGRDYSGAAISPFTEHHDTTAPLWHWTPSIAPAGMAVVTTERFKPWQGSLLVAALKTRDVRRLKMRGDELVEVETLFAEFGARLRDVREGPDGALYLLTDEATTGRLIRIQPAA